MGLEEGSKGFDVPVLAERECAEGRDLDAAGIASGMGFAFGMFVSPDRRTELEAFRENLGAESELGEVIDRVLLNHDAKEDPLHARDRIRSMTSLTTEERQKMLLSTAMNFFQ